MTISSSLNAGIAGLSANASRLATISDNISNSATNGYKRATLDFHSMVVGGENAGRYVAGGVKTTAVRLIDQGGALKGTDNSTDLSISGKGFLPTTPLEKVTNADTSSVLQLVTTGSFKMDDQGYLRTSASQVLMGWPIASDGTVQGQARDSVASLQAIRIDSNQLSANPTTKMSLALNLPATGTNVGASGENHDLSIEYFTSVGLSERLSFNFAPEVSTSGGPTNAWTMTVNDSATGGAVASYRMEFNDTTDAGTLASVSALTGGAYDPATGSVSLNLPSGPIELSLGKIGMAGGMSQLSNEFVPTPPVKNGSPVASLVSLEVDSKGTLFGDYDQGFTRPLFQIPVVDVANPNGLKSLNNQAYQTTNASGDFFLWDANSGPVGSVEAFTLEESNTDLGTELTQLIQTQRAYSSNAKVIQTVDEMLQETTNIKR